MGRKKNDNWSGVSHIRVRSDVLKSAAWKAISLPARALYVDLRTWMYTGKNGDISATFSILKELGYGKTSLAKYLRELVGAGLIAKTRSGGVAYGSKVCALYRFTDMPAYAIPQKCIEGSKPTHDHLLRFHGLAGSKRDVAIVRKAIDEHIAKEKMASAAKQKRRSKKINGSDSELVNPVCGSNSELVKEAKGGITSSNSELDKAANESAKVAVVNGFQETANSSVANEVTSSNSELPNTYHLYSGSEGDGAESPREVSRSQVGKQRAQVAAYLIKSGRSSLRGLVMNYRPTIAPPFAYKPPKTVKPCSLAA